VIFTKTEVNDTQVPTLKFIIPENLNKIWHITSKIWTSYY